MARDRHLRAVALHTLQLTLTLNLALTLRPWQGVLVASYVRAMARGTRAMAVRPLGA